MKKVLQWLLLVPTVLLAQENSINVIGEALKEIDPNFVECEIGVVTNNLKSDESLIRRTTSLLLPPLR
jgi:hypothetical protein